MSAFFRACATVLLVLAASSWLLQARPPATLGDPPPAPTPEEVARLRKQGPIALGPTGPFSVNIASREEVRNFFNSVYAASENFSIGWTGDINACAPGTTDAGFRDLVVLRINWFRAMTGVLKATSREPGLATCLGRLFGYRRCLTVAPPAA